MVFGRFRAVVEQWSQVRLCGEGRGLGRGKRTVIPVPECWLFQENGLLCHVAKAGYPRVVTRLISFASCRFLFPVINGEG